jgi:CheY-like chemotaxis protein
MKKILIVDDQVEVRDLVEVTLRVGEYCIFQAASGIEALEIARKEKPDLIIMDVMMPGEIDGYMATRILKEEEQTKNTIIIMLTARAQMIDKKRGYELGANGYLIKPFSPLELIKRVEEELRE